MTISGDEPAPARYPKRVELPAAARSPIPAPGNLAAMGLAMNGAYLPPPPPPFVRNDAGELPLTEAELSQALAEARAKQVGLSLSSMEEQNIQDAVDEQHHPPARAALVLAQARRLAQAQKYHSHCRLAKRRGIRNPDGFELELDATELAELNAQTEKAARRAKYQQAQAQWSTAKGARPNFPTRLDAEQYLALFKARADWHVQHEPDPKPSFEIDEHNRLQIWLICLYFAEDLRFETEYGYRLGRALMLRGVVGCGKTTILSMFRSNHRQSFQVVSCRTITDDYQERGAHVKTAYYAQRPSPNPERSWNQPFMGLAFDDLGTENFAARHMGNPPCNVMADILTQRWDSGRSRPPGATHFTTNLGWEDIEAIYHDRLYSRLRGSFNDIRFPNAAPDRRRL